MLLRSSSSPILGSLLPESPSPNHRHCSSSETANSGEIPTSVSFSSPSYHSTSLHSSSLGGFRRVCSDGNLEGLSNRPVPVPPRLSNKGREVRDPVVEEERQEGAIGGEYDSGGEIGGGGGGGGSPLFLAVGLGIDANDSSSGFVNFGGGGGRRGNGFPVLTGSGGERSDLEMFYKKLVEENPRDALFLRNYAQFLYQVKGDPHKAEEYYSRAILAEPGDGEVLTQYARLIWELYHDYERTTSYYDQAVEASPQDSHVLAAYANFLWETEPPNDVESYNEPPISVGNLASASA